MKIEIEVADEKLSNLLASAFKSGSTYWLRSLEVEPPELCGEHYPSSIPLETNGAVVLRLQEEALRGEGRVYNLDRAAVAKGLAIFHKKTPRHFADMVAGNSDATTGDVFLQCCLFGEVIFG